MFYRGCLANVYNLHAFADNSTLGGYTYGLTVEKSIVKLLNPETNYTEFDSDLRVAWSGLAIDHGEFISDLVLNAAGDMAELIYTYTSAVYLEDLIDVTDEDFIETYNDVVRDIRAYTVSKPDYSVSSSSELTKRTRNYLHQMRYVS